MLCDWESVFWGSSLFPVGNRKLRKFVPRGNTGGRHWNNCWALGGQAWLGGKACGEIPDLGVEGGGNFGAVTEVKHPDRAGRQVGRSAGRQVGRSASRQVCKSPGLQVARFASRRHSAREMSCARIEPGSPGRRCLLRAATGYKHTPQTANRKFGADSKGVVDFSSDLVDLCSKHSLESIFLITFRFLITHITRCEIRIYWPFYGFFWASIPFSGSVFRSVD
jgi:hypothetical protein